MLAHADAIRALSPMMGQWDRLRIASVRFLDTPFAADVAAWDPIEIWGIADGDDLAVVSRRLDCMGLVPALILGGPCVLVEIQADGALIRSNGGAYLRHPRRQGGYDQAVLWWDVSPRLDVA